MIYDSLHKGSPEFLNVEPIKMAEEYKDADKSVYFNYLFWEGVFAEKYGSIQIPTKCYMLPLTNLRSTDYEEFLKSDHQFQNQFWIIPSMQEKKAKLFESRMSDYYNNDLYHHRNRIAHNTLSYQQNLPELESLKNETDFSRNYFFWFAILTLIDEIFMVLYKEYSNYIKLNSYFEE